MIPEFWMVAWLKAIIATIRMALGLWLLRLTFIF